MKTRFTTLDICSVLPEINSKVAGMRLANVYDINNKTYLLKLAKPDSKAMLLMESGIRLHLSEFEWPKNMMPSGFSMKLRKHLRGRRLVSATQLGIDRIVDIQFGSDEAAYHVILELYDRGNIILTDHQYTVLTLLRFRRDKPKEKAADGDASAAAENLDVRYSVGDQYPVHAAKKMEQFSDLKIRLSDVLKTSNPDDGLKKILIPHLPYGAPCIEHCLQLGGFTSNEKLGSISTQDPTFESLVACFDAGDRMLNDAVSNGTKGYIIQKLERKKDGTDIKTNVEFHPFLFKQHERLPHVEFSSLNLSVDEFFGNLESQKADVKILQQEKSAYKKLENIKKDHEQRLAVLEKEQDIDVEKAKLIETNLYLVDQAIRVVRTAIANQIDWSEISSLLSDAKANGDPVAQAISKLKLESNEMTVVLQEEHDDSDSDEDFFSDDESDQKKAKKKPKPIKVDIDLGLSAHGNARKYYDKKRQAASKQQKTIDASEKAFKSAEKKVTQTLKEAATIHNIQKARKTFWFEKFLWFISSENYLVIGGRDAQQNEILVKKYLIPGDVYVHADLHGATSCIVKNPKKSEIPPKTLNEAGTMAICHSAAWTAKVVTSAWWVHHDQVSKTAPSGEYLTTGSFLIRGKKNYLPPSYLVYGFAILFKVDETCIHKHKDERKVATGQEDAESLADVAEASSQLEELEVSSGSDQDDEDGGVSKSENGDDVSGTKSDDDTQENDKSSDEEGQTTNAVAFPDTEVKIDYATKLSIDDDAMNEEEDAPQLEDSEPPSSKPDQRSKPRLTAKQRRDLKKNRAGAADATDSQKSSRTDPSPVETKTEPSKEPNKTPPQNIPTKRGQRNKAKKLKGKYKDQDEEERLLRMELLQEAQSQKARDRKAKKSNANSNQAKQQGGRQKTPQTHNTQMGQEKKFHPAENRQKRESKPATQKEDDDGSDEEREKILQNEHLAEESVDILNSLTGCPLPDDVLLFALPFCAPYNTVQNYKFKVKLTPGNTKKGKGAKTALSMFQNLRETTALEKDHLRSIKDNDLSRNIPGKIKVSAPNLQAYRKKK